MSVFWGDVPCHAHHVCMTFTKDRVCDLRANEGQHSLESQCRLTSGVLIRLVVTKGMPTDPLRREVTQTKAPRGTIVAIVGTRASCHPIPLRRQIRCQSENTREGLTSVDDRSSSILDLLSKSHNLIPRRSIRNKV
jgi:hypothetical protein